MANRLWLAVQVSLAGAMVSWQVKCRSAVGVGAKDRRDRLTPVTEVPKFLTGNELDRRRPGCELESMDG